MQFIRGINWRQISVHAVAMWFITAGTTLLSLLTDIELLQNSWAGNGSLPN